MIPRRSVLRRTAMLFVTCSITCSAAFAQGRGDYFNVESPQVSPIALADLGTRRVLLVCNTPDNSVEVWDTDESIQPASARFLQRLRVGLEPVSVHVAGNRFWTANFLGDSVTAGELIVQGPVVEARVLNTRNVGDEPMDLAFFDDGGTPTIFVTLHSTSALAWLDADTLAPHAGNASDALVQNPDPTPGDAPWGLKEPRAVRVRDGRVLALACKGGVTHAPFPNPGGGPDIPVFDLDALSSAIGPTLAFDQGLQGLGSTNFNGRFAQNGDLWVVGGEAQNFDNETKTEVKNEPSGFVQSTLYRVRNPFGASPMTFRRDTNKKKNGTIVSVPGGERALTMPTDLALYEANGRVRKVFVTAFSSDRIGVFAPPPGVFQADPIVVGGGGGGGGGGVATGGPIDIAVWNRRTVEYGASPVGGNPRWGPRGMTIGRSHGGAVRVWVLNRLDNSVTSIDPVGETVVESFPLANDPTPPHIRQGREFLYSADIDLQGFTSCASCHTDGRTDALSWKLGNQTEPPFELAPDPLFIASLFGTGFFASDPGFQAAMFLAVPPTFDPDGPDDKREMVTQSLQGLSNFEVAFDPGSDPDQAAAVRTLFTNAPFHWRGDKPSLRDFNEAFVTLLGGQDLGDATTGPLGLTDAEMDAYERFVHSINYPPNPQQPQSRVFSGDDPNHPVYSTVYPGSGFAGGASGLELFHTRESILANRSCVHCHTLPEGSNNRLTVFVPDGQIGSYVGVANRQPIESAAMRGLFQKEPLLEPDGNFLNDAATTPVVNHFGMNHNGIQPATSNQNQHTSVNLFIDVFFTDPTSFEARAVKQFAHEMDWGVAPMVGKVVEISLADIQAGQGGALAAEIALMEEQVRLANASLVVWGELPGTATPARGWRYYPITQSYLEEPGFGPASLGALAGLLVNAEDRLVFTSVPLGSERRIASPTGQAGSYLQNVPANVTLLPMVPDTAYELVPTFRDNWVPVDAPAAILGGAQSFFFSGDGVTPDVAGVGEVFAQALRLFQYGLLDGQNANDYGVSELRHEAPRRLRLSGVDIITGAKLLLSVAWPDLPYAGPPPSTSAGQTTLPLVTLELPLFPTDELDALNGDAPVWETAVELEPFWAYAMMLGGPRAQGVQDTIDFVICDEFGGSCGQFGLPNPPPVFEPTQAAPVFQSPFDPDNWNWFRVEVRNPGPGGPDDPTGPVSNATWQQLTME